MPMPGVDTVKQLPRGLIQASQLCHPHTSVFWQAMAIWKELSHLAQSLQTQITPNAVLNLASRPGSVLHLGHFKMAVGWCRAEPNGGWTPMQNRTWKYYFFLTITPKAACYLHLQLSLDSSQRVVAFLNGS